MRGVPFHVPAAGWRKGPKDCRGTLPAGPRLHMRSAWGPQSAFPRTPDAGDTGLGHGTGVRRGWGTTHGSPVCAAAAGCPMGIHTPRWCRAWIGRIGAAGAKSAGAQKLQISPRRGGFQPPEKPSPLRGEGVTAYAVTDEGSFFPRPSHRIGKGGPPRGADPLSPASPTVPEEKTMV